MTTATIAIIVVIVATFEVKEASTEYLRLGVLAIKSSSRSGWAQDSSFAECPDFQTCS